MVDGHFLESDADGGVWSWPYYEFWHTNTYGYTNGYANPEEWHIVGYSQALDSFYVSCCPTVTGSGEVATRRVLWLNLDIEWTI